MQERRGIKGWVLGSAALMGIGAFGPWVEALGHGVSGVDGSNDGWLVLAAAVIGGLLFHATRNSTRMNGVWALLGGIAGIAVTLYDRSNMQDAISRGGAFAQALVQVGWGLNLALVASISMTLAAAVHLYQTRGGAGVVGVSSASSGGVALPTSPSSYAAPFDPTPPPE